jgi:hypothetical protein
MYTHSDLEIWAKPRKALVPSAGNALQSSFGTYIGEHAVANNVPHTVHRFFRTFSGMNISHIVAGEHHAAALTSDGRIFTWVLYFFAL